MNLKFSYEKIESSCNEMHDIANKMKDIMEHMNQISSRLQNGNWEGKASDYFVKKLNRLVANLEEAYKEVEMAILYLANTAEGYQSIEKNIMSQIYNNLNISSPSYQSSNIFRGM